MASGVVVGYDQSAPAERALAEAASEAARRGVELTVVHAIHHAPPSGGAGVSAPDVAQRGAERARSRYPGLRVRARTRAGHAADILVEESSEADLLVLGHHGHHGHHSHGGFSGLRPGSVARRAVARAACPAMVVRGPEHRTRGTVVAAVHAGDTAEELLDVAYTEASSRGARLKAVSALENYWPRVFAGDTGHVDRGPDRAAARAQEALEQLLGPWPDQYPGVVTDRELIEGSPTTFLTGATTYADLIVVGVRRRAQGWRGARVGPIAEQLLMHADCPVLVVPHV